MNGIWKLPALAPAFASVGSVARDCRRATESKSVMRSRRSAGSIAVLRSTSARASAIAFTPVAPRPNALRVTDSITCCARRPFTRASVIGCEGSRCTVIAGFSPDRKSARGACSPNPLGNTIAARSLPLRTPCSASASEISRTSKLSSAFIDATMPLVTSL